MPSAKRSRRRLTPEFLTQLRSKRIAVLHPNDADGAVLTQQLQRIGCQVQTYWPPPAELPGEPDIVFCAVQPPGGLAATDWARGGENAAVIAVIAYENPTVFDDLLALGASWVITTPVRSAGILSALVMTLLRQQEQQEQHKRIVRLEQKLSSIHQVTEAKAILVRTRGVDDAEAYRLLRDQAMSKRVAIEEIARAIIHANAILSG